MQRVLYLSLVLLTMACSSPEETALDAERPWRQPGDVIDSILPMEEHERRFREGLTELAALTGGERSPEALAQTFLTAVSAHDSAALRRLLVDRAEFAWLVFPDHLYRRPPYELDPAIFWMQLRQESAKGLTRVLERHGGKAMRFRDLRCERDTLQLVDSRMMMWGACQLEYQAGDSLLTRQLFGSIIERDGIFKLLSYANDF